MQVRRLSARAAREGRQPVSATREGRQSASVAMEGPGSRSSRINRNLC